MLPVLPTVSAPKVDPPVLNFKSVLVVTALVKLVALLALLGSMAKVPAPLKTACDTITLGCVTIRLNVPPVMVVAPTVTLPNRVKASTKVSVPRPALVKLPVPAGKLAKVMLMPLVS